MSPQKFIAPAWLVLGLVVASTVLGLAGTDLVLPAVPSLPALLGGNVADAQLVVAAYVAGTAIGLLVYAALSDRYPIQLLFAASLIATALISFVCALVDNMPALIALRALHGVVAAGPAVFAPGIVKSLFDERRAVRAIGMLGSIEALAPAIAPIIGTWLLTLGGWRLSFGLIGVLALALALMISLWGGSLRMARRERGRYSRLLADPVYLRYALSQAFILGGLLTFVFGMPAVLIHSLGGSLGDFIVMQVTGIAGFIVAANLSGRLAAWQGTERLIGFGTGMAAVGALATLAYALCGGRNPLFITLLFFPVNTGLGLRGPPGFYRAVLAARGDDARGAALVILGILGVAALGTVVSAPLLVHGLVPLASIALALHLLACLSLALLPRLPASGT